MKIDGLIKDLVILWLTAAVIWLGVFSNCSTTRNHDSPKWMIVDKVVNDSIYRFSVDDGDWVTRIYYKEKKQKWTIGDTLILRKK